MLIHGLNNQSRSSLMEQIRPKDRILSERKTVRAPDNNGGNRIIYRCTYRSSSGAGGAINRGILKRAGRDIQSRRRRKIPRASQSRKTSKVFRLARFPFGKASAAASSRLVTRFLFNFGDFSSFCLFFSHRECACRN